ncbi:class I mannose-6-phosphate isomerase [Maribacter sp. HTCC2170]|uniref:class I mannose-6-phosphate isomerase n=1 Tax=Maribacter sp. (strain HTCC2170 / KCCM 42371) TaxID=313603 RepID=UPI00006BD4C1|nr:class I mannose-6-phosphate isomerase [Maribacter sp. HTCC2170]EAR02940.1 ROK family member transcriptional repressor [Maribacter sp. HTCC2170]
MQRKTSQDLIPLNKKKTNESCYDIYPSHSLKSRTIKSGYASLAKETCIYKTVVLDGYIGVDWNEVQSALEISLEEIGVTSTFLDIKDFLKPKDGISTLVEPFLGGEDPIFGFKANIELSDYFDSEKLKSITLDDNVDIQIIYGTGASVAGIEGHLVYFDIPKNELQFRMRANEVTNFGFKSPKAHKQMYKHFYFVDWPVLNNVKKKLLPKISIIVDQQRPGNPVWMKGEDLRNGLHSMSQSAFRVRPWFEPGVWGGQWMKERFRDLNRNVPNYAWSFEMIVPENGLLFESDGALLEVSFDMLMFQENENVLGKAAERFEDEFPIRFDFLDTFDGGNLSVQCHPKPDFIKDRFGENFTQDETYYILDAGDNAEVYLGFQENINPNEFKKALEQSFKTKEELQVENYVQKLPAKKHDLFLIPHGTIHCSGINNLVLEISATPYIFTFKMYDWQRLDLDGNPRPLNIDRAFENLNFERKGQVVQETLISKPRIVESGIDWQKIHLPTHPDHFYEIYRYEFEEEVKINTNNQCHVLMLVEGESLQVKIKGFENQTFHFAETFAIPAAAKNYSLVNKGKAKAKVVISFVKDTAC